MITTGMHYPADAVGEENYSSDLEATAFGPVMPILSRRDPGVLKGEVNPRGPSQGEGLGGVQETTFE